LNRDSAVLGIRIVVKAIFACKGGRNQRLESNRVHDVQMDNWNLDSLFEMKMEVGRENGLVGSDKIALAQTAQPPDQRH
jgi:hypothetical protein